MFILLGFLLSFITDAQASRTLQGPPFPWHDWIMVAYQGPNSIHQKGFDVYIQNVSSVQQTVQLICEFKDLQHSIGQWGGSYTPLQSAKMDNGTSAGTNKFQRSITIAPNEMATTACLVEYAAQQDMDTNYRDAHLIGTLFTTITISEDRGAVVAYINSRSENYGASGAEGPKLENNGALVEAMLRNISKTFFFNGGRAF